MYVLHIFVSFNNKSVSKLVNHLSYFVFFLVFNHAMPGRVAQSVTCLATDACLTADPGGGGREFDPGPFPYFRGD